VRHRGSAASVRVAAPAAPAVAAAPGPPACSRDNSTRPGETRPERRSSGATDRRVVKFLMRQGSASRSERTGRGDVPGESQDHPAQWLKKVMVGTAMMCVPVIFFLVCTRLVTCAAPNPYSHTPEPHERHAGWNLPQPARLLSARRTYRRLRSTRPAIPVAWNRRDGSCAPGRRSSPRDAAPTAGWVVHKLGCRVEAGPLSALERDA